ncbi:hypothetical protein CIHG_05413 [Coccidioides immitis H538.4]|uniref:Uncharacterized protein n=1 Tax=Coccidioides immitis H538.4 TaxID=396776 RepID=A0A0J8RTY7_COCIT|nr:hypothetical protein CIHG_05413 [Coccidioides immitis H538.4]
MPIVANYSLEFRCQCQGCPTSKPFKHLAVPMACVSGMAYGWLLAGRLLRDAVTSLTEEPSKTNLQPSPFYYSCDPLQPAQPKSSDHQERTMRDSTTVTDELGMAH